MYILACDGSGHRRWRSRAPWAILFAIETRRAEGPDPVSGNRALWDELTEIHAASDFYDLAGFRSGKSSLRRIESAELSREVPGKSLLHLQCHFGMDTLSWARLGALVTGVDFSPKAIGLARRISSDLGIGARFVCADVYDLPKKLRERFEVVYCSYGAINWLPDIERWAEVVAHFLVPGGVFYMVEFHPVIQVFGMTAAPELVEPYFHRPEPLEWHSDGTYAQPGARVQNRSYQWHHPLGDVVSALVGSGVDLVYLREHPAAPEQLHAWMVQDETGWWRAPNDALPMLFSLRGARGAG